MRWRVVALVAMFTLAMVPAASDAAQSSRARSLNVTVTPRTGSPATRFVITFRAAHATGRVGSTDRAYRIDASDRGTTGCRSSVSATARPAHAGALVHVRLASTEPWCAGTFRGQVWDVITQTCPITKACPAIVPLPRLVGKFTFRVTRG